MSSPEERFQSVQHVRVSDLQSGQRIDNFLFGLLKTVPRGLVYRLLRTGQVRVNKGRIKPAFKLSAGDTVRIPPVTVSDPGELHLPAAMIEQIGQAIIHEDQHWIVLNKPEGIAVHGGTGVSFGAIDLIQRLYKDTDISLVHRLDRETSGCLVLAKNRPAAIHFQECLRNGQVEKRYSTLLKGQLAEPITVDAPLEKTQPEAGERMVVVDRVNGKPARSHFTSQQAGSACSLVDVLIETGRTHQIRVHAAHRGHPVAGDTRYGNRPFNKQLKALDKSLFRMYLHAVQIAFPAPDDGPLLSFTAPVSEQWQQAFELINRR